MLSAKAALDSLTNSSHDPNRELFGLGLARTACETMQQRRRREKHR